MRKTAYKAAFVLTTCLLVVASTYLIWTSKALAADGIYERINFQGKLVGQDGVNVEDGDYDITFTLYDADTAGNTLWDEVQTVTVTDGVFQVHLGDVDNTIASVNFNSDAIYLGIKVETDPEMTPRIRMSAVPYAFNSEKVNGLTVTNTSNAPFSSTTTLKLGDGKTVVVNNSLTFSGTDGTTFTFPNATGVVVTEDAAQTLTNKTIGSTGLTFSGASLDLASATDEDLTLAGSGTGNLVLGGDFNSQVLIGASGASTEFPLFVNNSIGSNASLAINNINGADLFTASSSGTTIFTLTNDGGFALGATYDEGTLGDCLKSGGAGAGLSWDSCGGSSAPYWVLNSADGVISPINNTLDFAIGGTSTASADFAILNVNGTGAATATISGNLIVMPKDGAGGRIGIGTTSPNSPLNIVSSSNEASGALTRGANIAVTNTGVTGSNKTVFGISSNATNHNASGGTQTTYGGYFDANGDGGGTSTAYGVYGQAQGNLSNPDNMYGLFGYAVKNYSSDITVINGVRGWVYSGVSGGTITNTYGGLFTAEMDSNSIATNVYGSLNEIKRSGPGTIGTAYGVSSSISNTNATNAITTAYGFYSGWTNSGTITTGYGLYINDVLASSDYGLYQAGANDDNYLAGKVGLGSAPTSDTGQLYVSRPLSWDATGKALAIFDQIENQDIFTASASGTTIFTLTNDGGFALGATYDEGTLGDCLKSGGAGAGLSWDTCGSAGFSGEVDDTTSDALTFTTDDATPPTGVRSIYADDTNALILNSVSGGTVAIEINDVSEYSFSSTALSMAANNLTFTTGGITFSSNGNISLAGGNISDSAGNVSINDSVDVTGTITSTNATTGLILGATTDLTSATDSNLTIVPNGTGHMILSADHDSGLTIGTQLGSSLDDQFSLLVRNGLGNNAGLVVDQLNEADIFSASSSGTTVFTLTSAGGFALGDTYDEGDAGECLKSGGVGSGVSWGTCAGGDGLFTDSSGFTYLTDTGDDLVLGGTSIAAATFHMDVSAGTLYLGTDGSLNGVLAFYSSGGGNAPSIAAEADGDLAINAPDGTVNLGNGVSGNITLDPADGNLVVDLSSTGDFFVQRAGDTFATFSNEGNELLLSGGNTGGDAILILDQKGDSSNDILSASSSGTTVFTIQNDGTASTSGGLVINNAGSLSSTDLNTLTIGGATTGNIVIDSSSDGVYLADYTGGGSGCSALETNSQGKIVCGTDDTGESGSFTGEVDDTTNDALTFTSDDGSPPAGTVDSIFRDNSGDLNLNVISSKAFNVQVAGTDEYSLSASAFTFGSGNNLVLNGGTITDSSGNVNINDGLTVSGDISFSASTPTITVASAETFTIGDGTDTFSINYSANSFAFTSGSNSFTFDADSGITYAGNARPQRSINISPEYSGAVLTSFYGAGTDSNITGAMISDVETSETNGLRSYYQWERTTDSTMHFYTVAVRVTLPADFAAWQTSNALVIDYVTDTTGTTANLLDAYVYIENEDAAAVTSDTGNSSGTADTWTNVTIDDSALDATNDGGSTEPEWDEAGESAVIYLRMGSASSEHVRIGDIQLNYLSRF